MRSNITIAIDWKENWEKYWLIPIDLYVYSVQGWISMDRYEFVKEREEYGICRGKNKVTISRAV